MTRLQPTEEDMVSFLFFCSFFLVSNVKWFGLIRVCIVKDVICDETFCELCFNF